MAIPLRDALQETMKDWKQDVSPAWRKVLKGVEPNAAAVDPRLSLEPWEPVFPARKRRPDADEATQAQLVMRLLGAQGHAHIFSAFDGLQPASVKAAIIGQDPYPHATRATGRAFEAGDLSAWHEKRQMVPSSLRHIVQAVVYARTDNPKYLAGKDTWRRTSRDITSKKVDIPGPKPLFDRWQKRGVLLLNTGLTLTRYKRGGHPHQLRGHLPYWRPVIQAVVEYLVDRRDGAVVFMVWGRPARSFFRESGIRQRAEASGSWQTRVDAVFNSHPSYQNGQVVPFLQEANPFKEVNSRLRSMGARAIRW